MRNVMQSGAEYQCVRKVDSNGRKVSANCGSCVITKLTRTTCPYCRFKKCQQIGMTMNGYILLILNLYSLKIFN